MLCSDGPLCTGLRRIVSSMLGSDGPLFFTGLRGIVSGMLGSDGPLFAQD